MEIGKYGPEHLGPNLLRMQNKAMLSFGVCVDFKDKYSPDFVKTIPNIKYVAPY